MFLGTAGGESAYADVLPFDYTGYISSSRTKETMLIDTGATPWNYMRRDVAERYVRNEGVPIMRLDRPLKVKGYKGKKSPVDTVTHQIILPLEIDGHYDSLARFYVINECQHDIIIGLGWMERHGVLIDTPNRKLIFQKDFCDHVGAPYVDKRLEESRRLGVAPTVLAPQLVRDAGADLKDIPLHSSVRPPEHSQTTRKSTPNHGAKPNQQPSFDGRGPQICQIGAAAFERLSRKKTVEIFAISMKDIQDELDKRAKPITDPKSKLIPELYPWLDVFSKEEADTLPPRRPGIDHKIELLDDFKLRPARLTRQSNEELKVMKDFLEEHLRKDFLEYSKSDYASPILFAKKPGGGLRFCVDYRQLNKITKKNRTPLPLMDEILSEMEGCQWISKIDIRHAFNRIRIAEGDEDFTTFLCRFGTFKWKVLPFGLCNGPATFQGFINEVMMEYLHDFMSAYMDDLIIFSKTREEHIKHIQLVLTKLREAGLQADIDKCEFFVKETKFLGLIISTNGIRMDLAKIKAIIDWERPRTIKEILAFTGFTGFYRRFIKNYSKILLPITNLTKKNVPFIWSDECAAAFQLLKDTVSSAPVLRHFDPKKVAYVEVDASDHSIAGCMSQLDEEGQLRPVAFFCKKMIPAECNYDIYDKELLAIVRAFEEWEPELKGTPFPVQVLSDHQSLETFMTTKKLSRRQARWAEHLSEFDFVITYRKGVENGKADALTRQPGLAPDPGDEDDDRNKHQKQTILTTDRLHPQIRTELHLTPVDVDSDSDDEAPEVEDISAADRIRRAQSEDEFCQQVMEHVRDQTRRSPLDITLAYCTIDDEGLLRYRDKIWVPELDDCRTHLIQEVHDQPVVGHVGLARLLAILKRQFYWPRMDKTVARYVQNCHTCKRAKPSRDPRHGVLNPLPIPYQPWKDISMDFVTGLPMCQGYNAVLVVVCRLSKERHFIPCLSGDGGTSATETGRLLVKDVIRLHGLFDTCVSDRGVQFVDEMWQHLCRILKIKAKLSTAYHPQTDGQTEIVNAEMERYLRSFVSYLQDDWVDWLPLAELAGNCSPSATTTVSPFFANKGYHARMSFDMIPQAQDARNPRQNIQRAEADKFAQRMKGVWDYLQDYIGLAQSRMEEYANRRRQPMPNYQVGDSVYLDRRNIKTQRPSLKLDDKYLGPFKVLRKHGTSSFELDLPEGMRIHPVFHSSLLRLDPEDPLPAQVIDEPPEVIVEGEQEWEVERILDSAIRWRKLYYRAKWAGYDTQDPRWYPADYFDNAQEVVDEFHASHPNKPSRDTEREVRRRHRQEHLVVG